MTFVGVVEWITFTEGVSSIGTIEGTPPRDGYNENFSKRLEVLPSCGKRGGLVSTMKLRF